MRGAKRCSLLCLNLAVVGVLFYQLKGYVTHSQYTGRREIENQLTGLLVLNDSQVGKTALYLSDNSTATRFTARKVHLKKACKNMVIDDSVKNQRGLEVILAHGKLKFCGIEKVGSTFMKNIREKEKEVSGVFKRRSDFKTFVIVREPYGRLMSAWVDKLLLRTIWWTFYGRFIIGRFRGNATGHERRCGSDISFREFVRYFIYTEEVGIKRNPHFSAMSRECQFCYLDYDYYVHLETIKQDISYIYETVEHPLHSSMANEEHTLKQMAALIIEQRDKGEYKDCVGNCTMLHRAWWTFQLRGLISKDVKHPDWLVGEKCSTITSEEYVTVAWEAHLKSVGKMNKRKQRRELMVELYLQVPLLDRLRTRELFLKDFQLHNYESLPEDMFPEIKWPDRDSYG